MKKTINLIVLSLLGLFGIFNFAFAEEEITFLNNEITNNSKYPIRLVFKAPSITVKPRSEWTHVALNTDAIIQGRIAYSRTELIAPKSTLTLTNNLRGGEAKLFYQDANGKTQEAKPTFNLTDAKATPTVEPFSINIIPTNVMVAGGQSNPQQSFYSYKIIISDK